MRTGAGRSAPRRLATVGALAVVLALTVSACTPTKAPRQTGRPGTWRATVDFYRGIAELGGVSEDGAFSYGNSLHGRYMVKTGLITHYEDPASPWHTPEGDAAARNSNLAPGFSSWTERDFVEGWVGGPFHAIGILDPRLVTSGFGVYREGDSAGAGLDILRGLSGPTATQPVLFPGNGAGLPLTTLAPEYPDPLAGCGFGPPAGQPIMLLLPEAPGSVTAALSRNGSPVSFCLYTGDTYTNPADPTGQALGRNILGARNAVVLIPREPLVIGTTYSVTVTTSARSVSWSFGVIDPPASIG